MNGSGRLRIACIVLALLALALGCAHADATKNVIIMIGDGMGFEHVKAGSYYVTGTAGSLCFEPYYKCSVTTSCLDSTVHPITDSAAAASAIATGNKVNYLTVSQSPTGTAYTTMLEHAKVLGKRTGLIGTDPITRATPAAFGAHDVDRNNLIAIGNDYLNSSRPDVLMGGGGTAAGGSTYFSTAQIATAVTLGYQTAYTKTQMNALSNTASRVLGLFTTNEMTYEYDRPVGTTEPHLSEMTAKTLALMDADPDGFFLMIEGAKIDYGAHANDMPRTTREVVEFNNAVQTVLTWMAGRTDTLLIVTADHNTGGPTVTNKGAGIYPTATWTSTDHTAANVPFYATGSNSELVNSYIVDGAIDNTDIFRIMRAAMSPESSAAPFKIYDEARLGAGSGNAYYFGGVFSGTAYVGHISHGAQQWGDEQIGGTACLNATDNLLPLSPNNVAKSAISLGGWIYMSNGAGNLCRVNSWTAAVTPQQLPSPVLMGDGNPVYCDCITTDGTYIYVSTGTGSITGPYNTVYKYAVNHSAGTISLIWQSAPGGSSTSTHRFRALSYYGGKLYTSNNKGATAGHIFEIDCATGAFTDIATMSPGAVNDPYQVVRYGDKIFAVSLNDCLYTFTLAGTTWTQTSVANLGVSDLYGIAIKGDGTTAKYAWITHTPGGVSFWDLSPSSTPVGIGEARQGTIKNGYPIAVQDVVVTKVGSDGVWAEDQNRTAGAHVLWTGAQPAVGAKVSFIGGLSTSPSGEKQLTPNAAPISSGTFDLEPLFVTNKCTGTGPDGAGLANDGLLVKVSGVFRAFDNLNAVYIDDGSGVANDLVGGPLGLKVFIANPSAVPLFEEYILWGSTPCHFTVTGIVRLEKLGDGTIIRRIDARSDADVKIAPLP